MSYPKYPNFGVAKDIVSDNIKTKTLTANKINVENDTDGTTLIDLSKYTIGSEPGQFTYYNTAFYGPPYDNYIADDGTVTYNSAERYLQIDSSPFTKTFTNEVPVPLPVDGSDNRLHYFVFYNGEFPLRNDGSEFVTEIEAAAECAIGTIPPAMQPVFTNTNQDLRIANFLFSIQDFEKTFMGFHVLFCNESIYAAYERLEFGKPIFGTTNPDYKAFSHLVEISKRDTSDPGNDFAKIKIAINRKENTAKWFVNGEEKLKVNYPYMLDRNSRIYETGGPMTEADVEKVAYVMGTINALDKANPVYDNSLAMDIFSQGDLVCTMGGVKYMGDAAYIDPRRTDRLTGGDVNVGSAPFAGAQNFDFAVPAEVGTANRLFGNGVVGRIKYIKSYYEDDPTPIKINQV